MQNDWPTREKDMAIAMAIIEKYIGDCGSETFHLMEFVFDTNKQNMDVPVPEWMFELTDYFTRQYGLEKGRDVIAKVLTRCLLQHQTLH